VERLHTSVAPRFSIIGILLPRKSSSRCLRAFTSETARVISSAVSRMMQLEGQALTRENQSPVINTHALWQLKKTPAHCQEARMGDGQRAITWQGQELDELLHEENGKREETAPIITGWQVFLPRAPEN
jgi:hypothetical protein